LLAISAGRAWPRAWPALVAATGAGCALLFAYKWHMSSAVVLPTLILAVVTARALEHVRGAHRAGRWLLVSSGCIVVAFACRQLDVAGRFTGPDHWLQG